MLSFGASVGWPPGKAALLGVPQRQVASSYSWARYLPRVTHGCSEGLSWNSNKTTITCYFQPENSRHTLPPNITKSEEDQTGAKEVLAIKSVNIKDLVFF